jgi:hypothetical protein
MLNYFNILPSLLSNKKKIFRIKKRPKTTLIINHFISYKTLLRSIENINSYSCRKTIELIIVNDKGVQSSKIMEKLNYEYDKLINTNNLGEMRGYNNGSKLSSSTDLIIFSQDDDLVPKSERWYTDVIKEFKKDKKLGLIGLNTGGYNFQQYNEVKFTKNNKVHKNFTKNKKFYCSFLNIGPFIVKKDIFIKVNKFSLFAKPQHPNDGAAGHFSDIDLTNKIWLAGYKAMVLINGNTKKWIRRIHRDDKASKEEIIKRNKNSPAFYEAQKKFRLKYNRQDNNLINKIEKLVKKENKKIGIIY